MSIWPASARTRPTISVEAGRLAGAVGAEQSDHLAGIDRQVHVLDDLARAVALLQPLALNRCTRR
jgi:hypothetical protein